MNEVLRMVMVFIFGAGGLALINIIQERWKVRYQRKAEKEDRKEEKEDKLDEISKQIEEWSKKQEEYIEKTDARFRKLEEDDAAQSEGLKYMLLDRIIYVGQSYIKRGEVTFDDRKRLRDMHNVYHDKLGGNGDAKKVLEAVDALPLKQ